MGWMLSQDMSFDEWSGDTVNLEIEAMFFALSGGYRWNALLEALHQTGHFRRAEKRDPFVRQENASRNRKRLRALRKEVVANVRCKHCDAEMTLTAYKIEKGNTGVCSQVCAARHQDIERFVTIGGETRRLGDWIKKFGISKHTVKKRVRAGWALDLAITTPPTRADNGARTARERMLLVDIDGERLPLSEWCNRFNVAKGTAYRRICSGWTPEAAVRAGTNGARRGTFGEVTKAPPVPTKARRLYEIDGVARPLKTWAKKFGIALSTLRKRLAKGVGLEAALAAEPTRGRSLTAVALDARRSPRRYEFDGESKTLLAWCRKYRAPYATVAKRLAEGWALGDALRMRGAA